MTDLTLIEALKARMSELGHNQAQAARATGLHTSRINNILRGERDISRKNQWALYEYGIPAEVLIKPPVRKERKD